MTGLGGRGKGSGRESSTISPFLFSSLLTVTPPVSHTELTHHHSAYTPWSVAMAHTPRMLFSCLEIFFHLVFGDFAHIEEVFFAVVAAHVHLPSTCG